MFRPVLLATCVVFVAIAYVSADDQAAQERAEKVFAALGSERQFKVAKQLAMKADKNIKSMRVPVSKKPRLSVVRAILGREQSWRRESVNVSASPGRTQNVDLWCKYDWLSLGIQRGRVVAWEIDFGGAGATLALKERPIKRLDEREKTAIASLQGTWRVTVDSTKGKATPLLKASVPRLAQLDFIESNVVLQFRARGKLKAKEMVYVLDMSLDVPRFELTVLSDEEKRPPIARLDGIVEIKGNSLRLLFSPSLRTNDTPSPPDAFGAVAKAANRLIVLKRSKAKKARGR